MKQITLPFLILILGALGCDGTTIIPDCDNLGSDGPALKAAAVLDAVGQLTFEVDSLANELLGVCEAIGAELGVASPTPVGEETQREATCARRCRRDPDDHQRRIGADHRDRRTVRV